MPSIFRVALVALLTCYASVVFGQGGQYGSIVGSAFDQTGMPLKGVKVTAKSDTQIGGARSVYSNDEGGFRLMGLAPGRFEVRAEAMKLKPVVMKNVIVGISAPAEVNLVLEVETAQEEVVVIERAPLVNTKSAAIKETIDLDMIESMPLESRDNPHAQLIGSIAGASGSAVRGGKSSQTLFTQDGFNMREQYPTMKTSAAYEILAGGHASEAPIASGAAVNLVTKSGSNKYEFEFNGTADHNRLRYFLEKGETSTPNYRYVMNPTFAGPIIKDRLWFFANHELHLQREGRSYDPAGIFEPRPDWLKMINKGSLKLTWQVASRHRVTSLSNYELIKEQYLNDDVQVLREAQHHRNARRLFQGIIWEAMLTDTAILRSQAGITNYSENVFPETCVKQPGLCDHIPQIRQQFPRTQEYNNSDEHLRNDSYTIQAQNRIEWFISSDSLGEHGLSIKSDFQSEQDTDRTSTPGDQVLTYLGDDPTRQVTYYSNDPRVSEARYGWYIRTINWYRHAGTLADTWRPTRHLTLTPAISHIWGRAGGTNGAPSLDNFAFVPSLAVAWDATHDGRTVLRGSYSNYADVEVEDLARHTAGSRVSLGCDWNATSEKFDRNCTYSGGPSRNTVGLPCGPTGLDIEGRPCGEKLKIPRTHEYTAGAEREVISGVAVALDAVYKKYVRQFDTRETNRLWNASGTLLDTTGGFRNGIAQTVTDLGTPEYNNRRYMGATLGVRKREGRFKAQASYTLGYLEGASGDYGSNPGQNVYLYGYLGDDHRHEMKALATYQVASWISTGVRYSYRSGTPYNRYFRNQVTGEYDDLRARMGINPGTNLNDPGDDRQLRLPDLQNLNLQTRLNLLPLIGQRLELYVDVLNILALRTPTGIEDQDGIAFGRTTGRQGPFRIRLGLNYKY